MRFKILFSMCGAQNPPVSIVKRMGCLCCLRLWSVFAFIVYLGSVAIDQNHRYWTSIRLLETLPPYSKQDGQTSSLRSRCVHHKYGQHWQGFCSPNGATTFSIMTFSIMTLSITIFSITIFSITKNRHIQHNGTRYRVLLCWLSFMLNVVYAECHK
jgi:hypothetical protein